MPPVRALCTMLAAVAALATAACARDEARESSPTRPPSTQRPRPAEGGAKVGVSASLLLLGERSRERALRRLRGAGVRYVREELPWARIEPEPGRYDWSAYDRLVRATARRGMRIVAVVNAPPAWATGGADRAPASGEALRRFTGFVRRAIDRYGTRGSFWQRDPHLRRTPITLWTIWNEPYVQFTWGPGRPDGAAYARMFKGVVSAVEGADPRARFMLEAETGASGYAWPQPPFLGAMLDAVPDLTRYADIVSLHPFTGEAPPTACTPYRPGKGLEEDWKATRFQFCRVRDVRRILDSRGGRDVRIWITEMGYPTGGERSVSEPAQARYVRDVFSLLRTWRLVDGLVWYHYMTGESDPGEREDHFGLVRSDGTPKPAWNAFVQEARRGLPPPATRTDRPDG